MIHGKRDPENNYFSISYQLIIPLHKLTENYVKANAPFVYLMA